MINTHNVTKIILPSYESTQLNLLFAREKHPYHLVKPSPFPFLTGLFVGGWLLLQVFYLHQIEIIGGSFFFHLFFISLFVTVLA